MAKIRLQEIADKNLLAPLVKDANELSKAYVELRGDIQKVAKELKTAASAQGTSSRDVQKVKEAISSLQVEKKRLTVVNKEEEKIRKTAIAAAKAQAQVEKRLLQIAKDKESAGLKAIKSIQQQEAARKKQVATDKRASAQAVAAAKRNSAAVERQIRALERKTKADANEAARQKELSRAYNVASRTLNNLRKEYKDLAIQNKGNTKEAKALLRQIDRLDTKLKKVDNTVGQNQRKVGGYRGALNSLKGSVIGLAAGFAGVTAAAAAVTRLFTEAFRITSDYTLSLSKLQAVTNATTEETKKLDESARALGSSTKFTATQVSELQLAYAKLGFTTSEILDATEATLALATATDTELGSAAEVAGSTLRAFGLDASETQRVVDVMAKSFNSSALDIEKFRESMKLVAPIAKAANIPIEATTALLGRLANAGLSGSIAGTGLRNLISKLTNPTSALAKELGFAVTGSESLFKAFNQLKDGNIDLAKATELTDERSKAAFITLIDGVDSVEALNEAFLNSAGSAQAAADVVSNNLAGDVARLSSIFEGLILQGGALDNFFRGAIQGLTNFLKIFKDVQKESRNFTDIQLDTIKSTKRSIETNEDLVDSYEDLSSKTTLTTEEQIELNQTTNDLIGIFGASVASINAQTGALEINIQAVKDKIQADVLLQEESVKGLIKRKAQLQTSIRIANDAGDELADLRLLFSSAGIEVNKLFDALQSGDANIGNTAEGFSELNKSVTLFSLQGASNQEALNNQIEIYTKRLDRVSGEIIFKRENEEELAKIEQELLDLGIDLNSLANDRIKTAITSGLATGKEVQTNKTLSGTIKALREENSKYIKQRDEETQTTDVEKIKSITEEIKKNEEKIRVLLRLKEVEKDNSLQLNNEEAERDFTQNVIAAQKTRAEATDIANQDETLKEEERNAARLKAIDDFNAQVLNDQVTLINQKIENEKNATFETEEEQLASNDRLLDFEKQKNDLFFDAGEDRRKREADAKNKADDEALELEKEQQQKLAKAIKDGAAVAEAIADRFFEKKLKQKDDEIKASQEAQDRLSKIAETGTGATARLAEENLAFEKQVEAERLVEKEKALKRQQQVEFLLAGIKAFGAKVEAGDQTPVKSVLQDVGVLIAGIKALPGFFKGSSHVGKDLSKTLNTGVDDYTIRVDGREKVFNPEDSAKIGYNIENSDAADIIHARLHGNLMTREEAKTIQTPSYSYNSSDPRLLSEQMKTNELLNDMKGKLGTQYVDYDNVLKVFTEVRKEGNKTTRNVRRINGLNR